MLRQTLRLAVLTAFFCVSVRAQIGRATILGSVVDASNAPIAGAEVRVTRVETNAAHNTATNEFGLYSIPALPVGTYDVAVIASGFKRAVRSGIVLKVDDKPEIDFRLEIGAVTESVEVVGQTPLVDTASATVGKVIENTRMTSLPVNGRTVLSLVLLTPNVRGHTVNSPGFGDRGAAASNFSVNGSPAATSSITLDGSTNNTPRNGDTGISPAVDSIEEFKVQSGIMSAEYGYTLGGVVNLVTKSGTNKLHGTLYEFVRNDKLDSRNTFAVRRAPLRYNQFGGSLGGPIRRDRTFYFFNYEEWRLRQFYTIVAMTPTAAERSGDFSQLRTAAGALIPLFDPTSTRANPSGAGFLRDPLPRNLIPAQRLDKVAVNTLQFFPAPNRAPTNVFTNANNFQANLGTRRQARQETLKLDHRLTSKDSLSFRYTLWNHKDDNASNGNSLFPARIARARDDDYTNRNVNLTDIHSFSPTWINDLRVGLARQYFPCNGTSFGGNWPQKLGLPAGVPSNFLPRMNIQGYQTFPAGIATFDCLLSIYALQLVDNMTFVRGKHTLKAGLDLRKNQFNRSQTSNRSGTFAFNSTLTGNPQQPAGTGSGLASFLFGAVASGSAETDQPVSWEGYSQGYYVQDDWKATRRLTLNLGLRYDYQQVPRERHSRFSNFNPYARNPQNGVLGRLEFAGTDFGQTPVLPDRNDFAPRIGFALDLFGNGQTAIRGGYGIYYPLAFTVIYFAESSPGFNANTTSYLPPGGSPQLPAFQLQDGFPSPPIPPRGSALGPGAFESQTVNHVEPYRRTPYSQQWTLTIQHQLPGRFLLETGYSGNKGTKLVTPSYDLNQMDPQYLSLGRDLQQQVPNPYAGRVNGAFGGASIARQQLLRPYPYYGTINISAPHEGSSTYHSWLLNVERRMSNGLVFLASYTFGKLINEGTTAISSSQANGDQLSLGNSYRLGLYNRRLELRDRTHP